MTFSSRIRFLVISAVVALAVFAVSALSLSDVGLDRAESRVIDTRNTSHDEGNGKSNDDGENQAENAAFKECLERARENRKARDEAIKNNPTLTQEQRKAALEASREQWKAERDACKARYGRPPDDGD